ncbi:hypothetical protein [Mangrovihabitans endophyticus]|uniref:Uncharacterized protein n=1 Tax=Mangrovihabitans endophyticus TaxID=1751298 RepID=A0A8J3FPZ1_9ACTN|nr:hypothetical protein [Mangrovihabitans endophyticus]GGK96594.1 hypothetical protein GCM10012284_33530 [Mangrovihabitans endophyticus]
MTMDRLDAVLATAGPLLRRVDEVLAAGGAPPDHRVWARLRQVRLLPGDAAYAIGALRPAEAAAVVPAVRSGGHSCAAAAVAVPPPQGWAGAAASSYEQARRRMVRHLSGSADSLDRRFRATTDLAESIAGWMTDARAVLAGVLAGVLGSAEAVTLSEPAPAEPPSRPETLAAAEVAARVLDAIAMACDDAERLIRESADLAAAVPAPTA